MRLILCTASLDPASGGPARSVPQLSVALAGAGCELGLWSPKAGPAVLPDCTASGAIQRFSGSFTDARMAFGRLDLIHDNGIWLPCHHQVAKKCKGIPRVVSPRGMLEPWALQHKRWKKWLAWHLFQKRDLRSANLLHATSDAELAQLRRLGFHQPAVVLPNGVALPERFRPDGLEKQKPATRTALFLSRLHRKKGLEMLVEAWAEIRPVGWKMHVVGPDEHGYQREIMNAVSHARLNDCWSFGKMVEGADKWNLMKRSDLFILPSFSENFGIVVAEALAMGVPVITTTGTPWSGLEQHQCGWWVEPTPAALAKALRQAVSLPVEALTHMGERGKAWALAEFDWAPIGRRMAEAYRWVLGGGPVPMCVHLDK